MTIGIIGAGKIAKAFARQLIKTGYNVAICNSRGPQSMKSLVEDLGIGIAVTTQEAAQAKIVLLAVQWSHLPKALAGLPPGDGRIVIDATNPSMLCGSERVQAVDLAGKTSSEIVAELVPGARLVKAFNTIYYKLLETHRHEEHGRRVIFLSGDDRYAK